MTNLITKCRRCRNKIDHTKAEQKLLKAVFGKYYRKDLCIMCQVGK